MNNELLALATRGSEVILYVLVGMSLISIAVALERSWLYYRVRIDLPSFLTELVSALNSGKQQAALQTARSRPRAAEARVALAGLENQRQGGAIAAELMDAMALRQRQRLDRRLSILGTIGSNAPFVGLLGTVMGIIKAFRDLSLDARGGPSVVMAGIAEALVATAIGLVVAIPAVVAFNYFKNREKRIVSNMQQVERTLRALFDGQRRADATELADEQGSVTMGHVQPDQDEEITGINVVPLVDIVLVLLIIFMVTANFMSKPAIDLELPQADTGDRKDRNQFSLLLGKDGSVQLGDKRSSVGSFAGDVAAIVERFKRRRATTLGARGVRPSRLQLEAMARDELTMVISADTAVRHGRVIFFIDTARKKGVYKYAFNVDPATRVVERY